MPSENDRLNEALLAYLRAELDDARIAYQSHPTRLQGGFETQIYRFQLQGAPEPYAQPLILRLYPARYGTGNAVWESTIQNALAAAAYPVARAYLARRRVASALRPSSSSVSANASMATKS